MKQSAIGWADFSGGNLNFVSGCTPVSESCQNCYARAIAERFGRDFDTVLWDGDKLNAAMDAKYILTAPAVSDRFIYKRGYGSRPICFVCDTGDFFHIDVPNDFIIGAMEIMGQRADVDWMILTKRPERMAQIALEEDSLFSRREFYPNIWIGVTAENQDRLNERMIILADAWKGPSFVSIEPMLEPMDLEEILFYGWLDWVICGAESGPNLRPFEVSWAKELYEQCRHARVPFFGKQDSGPYPGTPLYIDGKVVHEWPGSMG
jgi:protein gp37